MNNPPKRPPFLPDYARVVPPSSIVSWTLPLEVVTPLYGGGPRPRDVDRATPVRVSGVRGQLRFWWRALFAGQLRNPRALYQRERELWGGLGANAREVSCSRVSIAVSVTKTTSTESSDVTIGQPDAYALWPARETNEARAAVRFRPGLAFDLEVRVDGASPKDVAEVRGALRAWLLFGGVGGRTRRGCGAVALSTPAGRAEWLPERLDPDSVRGWLSPHPSAGKGFPSLAGAGLYVGATTPGAAPAWHAALTWLRDFRQGTNPRSTDVAAAGAFARLRPSLQPGAAGRPGRSRWPEPDVVRNAFGPRFHDHVPQIKTDDRSWPRAQFGLPIQMQFQRNARPGAQPYPNQPPPRLTVGWRPNGDKDKVSQRLASPLIVKPVQTRTGHFVSAALWLDRTLPASAQAGRVDRERRDEPQLDARTTAPMSRMPAAPLFTPLAGKTSVRDAFCDWLVATHRLNGGTL